VSAGTRYTRQLLEEAAAHCNSLGEVIHYVGAPPGGSAYGHLKRRMERFGIDTSHFRTRHDRVAAVPVGRLSAAVAGSLSLAEVGRKLELPDSATVRAQLKRAIDRHGLSTAHLLGQAHYRDHPSPRRKSADQILRRLQPHARRESRERLHRALHEKGVPCVCDMCGTGERWQGRRLVLEIDHVNGDARDNRIENLRYLCPSCHSQTRTFALARRHRQPGAPEAASPE
jgi:hypothetical protein